MSMLFHVCTQLLWRPSARKKQPLRRTNWAPAGPSVTSRASTSPFSAGTPPASAGAWTAAAGPSRAPPWRAARSVPEVKTRRPRPFLLTAVADINFTLVYLSGLSSPNDGAAPAGDGRLQGRRWDDATEMAFSDCSKLHQSFFCFFF